jgi:GxxExxY protein
MPRAMEKRLDDITHQIIGAAIEVHRELGPGLLESGYQASLAFELVERGLIVREQVALPLLYKGRNMGLGYRLDMLVEDSVVVEVKAIERFERVHLAQVMAYLRMSRCKVGLLLNFNVKWLGSEGVKRVVSGFDDSARLARPAK